jgi:MFS family permease
MTILTARVPPQRRIHFMVPLAVTAAAPLILTAADPGLLLVAVLWAVSGAGAAYQLAANVAFVTAVPNARRAQAFGLVGTGLAAGQGAAILAAGVLAGLIGPGPTVAVFGIAGTLAALALAPAARAAFPTSAPAVVGSSAADGDPARTGERSGGRTGGQGTSAVADRRRP